MRLDLAATCVTLVFIIAQVSRVSAVEKSCPAYRNCGIPWNIESTSKQRCCEGVATVHGCRSQGTTMACWCNSYSEDACRAHRSKCPEIKTVKSERNTNVENGKSLVSQMKNQVDTSGMNANYFFNNFFMPVYKQAYRQDTANLIAFNALMSETNPPAPNSRALGSFLFSIFKALVSELPEVGKLISMTLDLVAGAISIATNVNGNHYQQEIAWKQFLQAKALSYSQAEQNLRIGLWSWTQAWWKKNNFPGIVKGSSSKSFHVMSNMINKLWSNAKTQQESYLSFIASYFNSVGAGFMVKCQTGNRNGLAWGITQVPNSVPLMQNLMRLTDNCIEPSTNFKDNNGHPVSMGVIGEVCKKTGVRTHCTSGIILNTAPLAITSQFSQTKDSASLSPSLCYHSSSRKFPITFKGSTNRRAISSGDQTPSQPLNLPLTVGGTVLGLVLLTVAVVVTVVVVLKRKGVKYSVDEQSKLAEEATTTEP